MSRRIDVELTSTRTDGTWTWRAAGAKEPKGEVAASLVPDGVGVGDVVKVDADFLLEGIEILAILPPKAPRSKPETLEMIGSGAHQPGVTTQLAPKRGRGGRDGERRGGRGRGGRDGERRGGKDRGGRDGERRGGKGRDGRGRDRDRPKGAGDSDNNGNRSGGRGRDDKRPRPDRKRDGRTDNRRRDHGSAKPKPKRLRPKRVRRAAAMAEISEEQHPIAEQVLRGGMPAVRKAIADQNAGAREADQPEIDPIPLMEMAEKLLPTLKAAEWLDRADAAKAAIADVSLADLRSVVVAADGNTRTDEARLLADELRRGLTLRLDLEQAEWLGELKTAVADGRTVRALRMSSRPPKAGTPLPPDLMNSLAEQASAALASDVSPQRWGTVADAVSYSPARIHTVPAGIPAEPGDELLATMRKIAGRVPEIAKLFGVEPTGRRRRPPKPPAPPQDVAPAEPAAPTDEEE